MDPPGIASCGIMMGRLIDPASQFISWLSPNEMNAVGFYYPGTAGQTMITLYNVHNNEPIPWMRMGSTLDRFLGSPFVSMIRFFPWNAGTVAFRASVVAAMAANSESNHDLNRCYTHLWLRFAGLDLSDPMPITGYTLCNRVLLDLTGSTLPESATELMTQYLEPPITISTRSKESATTSEMEYVVMECRPEITRLIAIFVDLFTSHSEFREGILRLSWACRSNPDLSNLFQSEGDLVTHMISSLANGTVSIPTLNDFIAALSTARVAVGAASLPFCIQSQPKITAIDTEMPFSLSVLAEAAPLEFRKHEPLSELGAYLEHLSTSSAPVTVDLGTLIGLYNRIVDGTHIPGIANTATRTRTVPALIRMAPPTISVPMGDLGTKAIPCHNGNLGSFTEAQLYEILVYVDSLRASDGTGDTRFAALMNDITQELALRLRKKKMTHPAH